MLDNEKKPKALAPIQDEDEVDAVKFGQNRFRQNQNPSGGNGYRNNGSNQVQNQPLRQLCLNYQILTKSQMNLQTNILQGQ